LTSIVSLADGIVVVALRFLGVLPHNGDPWLLVILVADSVFGSAILVVQGVIASSVIADILDQHELNTGYRQEAMFSAALSFSGKATSGLGIVLGGLILSLIGLPQHADPAHVAPDVVRRLGLVVGIGLPALYIVPIWLVRRYRITREVHAGIRQALDARRAGRLAA
jgi:Na+/melibiose symporter-like transporter